MTRDDVIGAEAPAGVDEDIASLLEQGVIVLDCNLRVVTWNRWMEQVTRLTAEAVQGRPLLRLFPELAGTERGHALERALTGEVVVFSHRFHEYLLPLPAPPGFSEVARMQQSARIAPITRGGRIVGVLVLIQDVTERLVRETELRAALERAQTANQAKVDFLSSMSHELRTPLNVVLGYADLMMSGIGGTLTTDHTVKLDRIKTSVWHLLAIIDEILLFSRVEAGKEVAMHEPVELVGILHDTTVMLHQEAVGRGLELRSNIPVESLTLLTDARRVRQILLNLLGNALKFTEAGGVTLTLELPAGGDRVAVHVEDTGKGIPPARLREIFEPFTRVDPNEGPTGTGLGLPLSRRLAKLLGGELTVVSELGRGSKFTLNLPVDPEVPIAPDELAASFP